ncbi:hypothetical protein HMP09_1959 [Sphingomonas sp. HMP9]|uniref:hypothetical protein n=1 Tax=Sphingomonas sp. HMP9 TaxID=1517554 RepID=UPI0015965FBB|nr:hypothetical protein [Sphingomonas sp. HMP9]BCA62725.1 hypothetical protein HMP09_1959 [Sphingomonas sp. HMP9]
MSMSSLTYDYLNNQKQVLATDGSRICGVNWTIVDNPAMMCAQTARESAVDRTAALSPTEKVGEAIRLSLPHLPTEARQIVASLLEPRSLAIIGASVVAWAGSHLIGVGEFVDVILLAVGVVALGFSVFEGAREMLDFAETAVRARSERELDIAGKHFARAVTILGISTVQAVLLRGGTRAVRSRTARCVAAACLAINRWNRSARRRQRATNCA